MNRKVWSAGLVSCVALLCVGSTLMADDAADAKAAKAAAHAEAKAAKGDKAAGATKKDAFAVKLPPDFAEMAKALNLDQDTQLKLAEISKVRTATAKEFQEAHSAERTKLVADQAAAKTAGNKDGVKEAAAKLADLAAQEKAKVAPYEDAALALLTPAQQQDWKVYKVSKEVLSGMHNVKLSDEQMTQVKTLVSGQLDAITAAGDNDKARKNLIKGLRENVEKNILTGDQLASIQNHAGDKAGKMMGGAAAATQPAGK